MSDLLLRILAFFHYHFQLLELVENLILTMVITSTVEDFLLQKISLTDCLNLGSLHAQPGGGGEVLPYVNLTGTCGPIGYGFQGVLS